MHPTRIDLAVDTRQRVIKLLSACLADAIDLESQTKQAHWNVKGPSFIALHELFDKLHGEVDEYADLLAERIAQLGGSPTGTVRAAAAQSRLKEYPLHISSGREHVEALSAALAAFGGHARKAIEHATEAGDADTADIFTEISRGIDKSLWFVEAHGQATE